MAEKNTPLSPILHESYYLLFERTLKVVRRRLEEHYSAKGVPLRQVWILMACRHADCNQKAVSGAIGVRESEIGEILDKMQSKGLIRRVRNPHDRREILLRPTGEGRKILKWLDEQFEEASRIAYYPLDIPQLNTMRDLALAIIRSEQK